MHYSDHVPARPFRPSRPLRPFRSLRPFRLGHPLCRMRAGASAVAVLAVLATAGSGACAQSYSQPQLQEIFASHLAGESLRSEITPSGNVRFRRQGRTYVIHVDERDPLYFRMTMAFAVEDKSPAMRQRRLEGCNAATSEVKVVKCFLDDEGDPTFATEMFLIVPGDFKMSFMRQLRALDTAYERFSRQVAEGR